MRLTDEYSYGIVVDSGSSGSRLQVYRWKTTVSEGSLSALNSPPEILHEKDWQLKISPGVSTYKDEPKAIWSRHFKELAEFAEKIVPISLHLETPVFVLATAGMRLLEPGQQKAILSETCSAWKKHTKFKIDNCNEFVQIIDGSTEGIYGWLGLNYLKGVFQEKYSQDADTADEHNLSPTSPGSSVGFMDMGGASTQLAFVPSQEDIEKHRDDLSTVVLRNMNGDIQHWNVFVETWLGFGANEARKRYLSTLISLSTSVYSSTAISDPCMPRGATTEHHVNGKKYEIKGIGNFDLCQKTIYPLLLKNLPCKDFPCLFNGIHTPNLNYGLDTFVGISEYWYTAQDILGVGGDYDALRFNDAAREFCELEWSQVLENSDNGKYLNLNPDKFLKNACFKANWVVLVLHDGFELPLDLKSFSLASAVDGAELTWTLGKILLYASSQVPSLSSLEVGIYPSELSGKKFISGSGVADVRETIHMQFPYLFFLAIILAVWGWYKKRHLRKLVSPFTLLVNKFTEVRSDDIDLEEGLGNPAPKQTTFPPSLLALRTRLTMSLSEEPTFGQNPLGSRSFSNFNKPFSVPKRSASAMFYSFSENASRESLNKDKHN